MTILKEKLITLFRELSEYHHSGEDEVIYTETEEELNELADSVINVINTHNHEK